MFRSARWRSEKNKIKAVFKFQFRATQVEEWNAGALVVSVVPGDVGKPTARLEKGVIREGSCRWEYPVYETVKFVRDAKTGKINERMYHFIVSSRSSKNSLVGEVSIDFANYAWATKASTVSLPLNNPKSNGILHVTIQRLQSDVEQRDVDEAEDKGIKSQNGTLSTLLSNGDVEDVCAKAHTNEVGLLNNAARSAEINGNHRVSSESDITMSSSESSSGLNTPRELGSKKPDNPHDRTGFLAPHSQSSAPHKPTANASAKIYEQQQQSQWEWSADSDHGLSTDDSTNGSQSILMQEKSEDSDIKIEKLKAEIVALARQVDMSDLELQTLRKQIVKERKRGQDLSREVVGLTQENDALKEECEQLKAFQKHIEEAKSKDKLQLENGDPMAFLEEIRQELWYEKDLNSNLRLQLQKTQEANAELILAVKDLDEMLELKNKEILELSKKLKSHENAISRSETDDEEQKALEELVKEHRDTTETHLLEQKIMDLRSEIEIYRRDKDELEMQMEQLALDYEILKQEKHEMSYKVEQSQLEEQLKMQYECSPCPKISELEAQIENLENELKKQSKDYSDALTSINELETNIKFLEEECEKQANGFEADLEVVMHAKVEQEQRAIRAEEELHKTRLKNAETAEKLQEEFKKLSRQMASTFDANEKVAMKALAESSELRAQKSQLEERLQRANEELQSVSDGYEGKMRGLSNQLNSKMVETEQMLAELGDKSRQLDHQKKHEEEQVGALSQEVLRLKSDLERLTIDKNILAEQAKQKENLILELEKMKTSMEHTEVLMQRGNIERNELVNTIVLMKKEAEKSLEELNRMRCLKDEKEKALSLLQAEAEALKVQCDNLKHSIFEDEQEKEKLRKQVFQLKGELKKEEAFTTMEKKLKESNKRATFSDATKTTVRNNKSVPVPYSSKEVANLKEKIKSLEGQIKSKETALEMSTRSFLEKERDLQKIIEELEGRVEEFNQSSAEFCNNPDKKLVEDANGIDSNGLVTEDLRSSGLMSEENGDAIPLANSNEAIVSGEELKTSTDNSRHCDNETLLCELASLKEINELMESELKEMQERYSEISLKFAEVEGERQKLVMTLRNLKNAKRS